MNLAMPVQAGNGYIRFKPKFNPINIRTTELIVVEKNEQKKFLFINNTIVVNESNSEMSTLTSLANAKGIFQIGDIGPAGGIVFYDKGMFSNGWQYLEAAPLETEVGAQWGAYGYNISGTSLVIGSGKRNTALILEKLNELGENGKAAQISEGLNFDGYTDWFLPSRDELLEMMRFSGKLNMPARYAYWSSSQYNAYEALYCYSSTYWYNSKNYVRLVRAASAF
jgi:hypothetical protein